MARPAISATISEQSARMMQGVLDHTKATRSEIIDKAILSYCRNWIKSEYERMYAERSKEEREEDKQLAEMGMADYWEMINRDEK